MTNKRLQELLMYFPDDIEIAVSVNGSKYCEPMKPRKKFMGTTQKDYLVIEPKFIY